MGKVLSAQGSGYFPTCISQDDPPYNYPSGSLQDIMTFYWRIKKFNVTISGSGIAKNGGNSVVMNGSFPVINNYQNINSESELVCNLPNIYNGNGGEIVIGGNPRGELFASLYHTPNYYQKSGSPNIQTDIGLSAGISADYFFYLLPINEWMLMGSYSINFYGGSISGKLYSPPSSFLSGSFNIKFEATEYWSYGGTYDTATGAPL